LIEALQKNLKGYAAFDKRAKNLDRQAVRLLARLENKGPLDPGILDSFLTAVQNLENAVLI